MVLSLMKREALIRSIEKLKDAQNIIILAHNYQPPEIQDIADFLGDSLDLSLKATKTTADRIVFCGVDFMAESAKILNPSKTVIHPEPQAKCPMAGMVEPDMLTVMKQKHPKAAVVSYINTTADVKALTDICCTSANGQRVVRHCSEDQIIFVPDVNLGLYIQRSITDKELILWPGICPTHHAIDPIELTTLKQQHPTAEILVHPECRPAVIDIADHVFSTSGMVHHAKKSDTTEFIIGTEKDMCYRLQTENPEKIFYPVESAICPNMKKITLEKVLKSITNCHPTVELSPSIMAKAKQPLQKMMDIGRGD